MGGGYGLNHVIGCGLTHDRKIFFTMNGDNQGLAFTVDKEDFNDGLFPAVHLNTNCEVIANFGKEKFAFDPTTNCKNELYQFGEL